jgi:superfamily II DNA helicase RecQ
MQAMALRFFHIPSHGDAALEAALNQVLSTFRIIKVDRNFVINGDESYWAICVDYLNTSADTQTSNSQPRFPGKAKVDYRLTLSESDFAIFAKLRDLRKEIASRDAVPVYAIFTNEQLAQMVIQKATTRGGLENISGVGDARVAKYGDAMLELLCKHGGDVETNRESH